MGEDRVGKIEAFPVRQRAAKNDLRRQSGRAGFGDVQADAAIIEQEVVARLARGENLRMRKLDALRIARRGIAIENEGIAGVDARFPLRKGADPQFRPLQVCKNADRPVDLRLDRANRGMKVLQQLVGGVAHIDAEDIRAGQEELLDDLGLEEAGPSVAMTLTLRLRLTAVWFPAGIGAGDVGVRSR